MYRDLNLRIPETLFSHLEQQAKEHGVSVETLCFSLLSGQKSEDSLIEPTFYSSLALGILRAEIRKVIESGLTREEVRKRVNALELEVSRRYIR
jgi:hypothetical protein